MILDEVLQVIRDRQRNPFKDSYVSCLIAGGTDAVLKKIGEEAAEVIIAAKGGGRRELVHEMADLWFHCLVLLAEEGLGHEDVFAELEARAKTKRSGT